MLSPRVTFNDSPDCRDHCTGYFVFACDTCDFGAWHRRCLLYSSLTSKLRHNLAASLVVGLGLVATYTGYVIGQFTLAYPHVHNIGDGGEVLFGAIGRELFTFAQVVFLIFLMASHVLTFSIMLNTLAEHATCTIVFTIVGMAVSIICTLPRTLLKVSHLCILCKHPVKGPYERLGLTISPSLHLDLLGCAYNYVGSGPLCMSMQRRLPRSTMPFCPSRT